MLGRNSAHLQNDKFILENLSRQSAYKIRQEKEIYNSQNMLPIKVLAGHHSSARIWHKYKIKYYYVWFLDHFYGNEKLQFMLHLHCAF